jgi:hypothetical protein
MEEYAAIAWIEMTIRWRCGQDKMRNPIRRKGYAK